MTIYTIGFARKQAKEFFEALHGSGARHLLDVRRRNTSQLAGFTKRDDLCYFLRQIVHMEYHEEPVLAPEEPMLREYRSTGDWPTYERRYLELIRQRRAEQQLAPELFEEGVVLLCSEAEPTHCHRRLAAEYLARSMSTGTDIVHL